MNIRLALESMRLCLFLTCLFMALSSLGDTFWRNWDDKNFEQAKKENKLLILDLQAVWCHWCHVMEEKTYANSEVKEILNAHFIGLRVDQDSRPDIANRYQDYGWPATIIFNSDGKEIAKESGYIPPEDMITLLERLVKNPVATQEDKASESAPPQFSGGSEKLAKKILENYDKRLGGWKGSHKFLDANLTEYFLTNQKDNKNFEKYAKQTLDGSLKLIDPVWSGLYQYSVGGHWNEPHYERIMSYQADGIRSFAMASVFFKNDQYLKAAKSIENYLSTFLLSPEGAYYTSQDADLVDGQPNESYFRLSDKERRKKGIPRIDKHTYARENAWVIQALCVLYEVTGEPRYLERAQNTAQWVLKNRSLGGGGFSHDQKDSNGPFLADNVAMGNALIELGIASGDQSWTEKAMKTADYIQKNFANQGEPGYTTDLGRSKILKPLILEDENLQLARFTNMIFNFTKKDIYKEMAQKSLQAALGKESSDSYYSTSQTLLVQRQMNAAPIHVTVVGHKDDPQALILFQAALQYPSFYKQMDWWDKRKGPLLNSEVSYPEMTTAAAFACAQNRCSLPARRPQDIAPTIDHMSK
jgi:uncharacterized protein YyaL (SSP411 family)